MFPHRHFGKRLGKHEQEDRDGQAREAGTADHVSERQDAVPDHICNLEMVSGNRKPIDKIDGQKQKEQANEENG